MSLIRREAASCCYQIRATPTRRRAVHWLPSAGRGPVERALDTFELAVAEFRGRQATAE